MTRRVHSDRIRTIISRIAKGDPVELIMKEENIDQGHLIRLLRGQRGSRMLALYRLAEAARKCAQAEITTEQFDDARVQSISPEPPLPPAQPAPDSPSPSAPQSSSMTPPSKPQ